MNLRRVEFFRAARRRTAAFSIFFFSAWLSAGFVRAESPKPVDFAHQIVPILKSNCVKCHGDGRHKGNLSIDTREEILKAKALVPGKSGQSELFKRITSDERDERMPPAGNPRLEAAQIALVRQWIDEGAVWEPGFTFKSRGYQAPLAPRRPTITAGRPGLEAPNPIDRILEAYYTKQKIEPPQPLDDTAFVRRVYLDLIGLLPTPEEADGFIKDSAGDKRDRLARRLLAENRCYADHWLTFWNDLLRNDYEGTGYIDGGREQISGWLYRSLLENKPYDQFVRELISPTPESEGFIKGIVWRGAVNASQTPELQFSQNVSQVFFGINMKCASCHDSFIDTWKLDDAYGLAAIAADGPLPIYRCDKATGRQAVPHFLWPELGRIDPKQPRAKRLEQLAKLVTDPANGRFTRTIANRVWDRLMGGGIVRPVDIMANQPWSEDLLDYLATYLADHHYDLKELMAHIVSSRAYQSRPDLRRDESTGADYVFRGPRLRRLTAEQFIDALWMTTGTAPAAAAAKKITLPPFPDSIPPERRFVRASLMTSDLLMRSLGRPNREQVVTTRPDQLTTLQALDLTNGAIFADTLARGAANLLKTHPEKDCDKLIEAVYRAALCRPPTAAELKTARATIGSPPTADGVADFLWTIFMLPEFQLIR